MKNLFRILVSTFLFVCFSSSLFAGGFQIYQAASPEAKALGAAVVARDDLISAAWYNPAAVMGFDRREYSSGYSFAWINQDYAPGNGLKTIKKKDKMHFIPNSHYIHPINSKYTAVLSMYTPFGLGMKWNDDDIRNLASSGLFNAGISPTTGLMAVKGIPVQADLQIPALNIALATKASRKFSVSGGLSIMKADMKMRILTQLNNPVTNAAAMSSIMKYQAEGWGFGYLLAGHYKMNSEWNLGFKYSSAADIELHGAVEDHLDPTVGNARVKGDLNLPTNFTFGVANSSIDKWILSLDVLWSEWSRYDRLLIEPRDAGMTKGGMDAKKDWNDTLAYRFGAEYKHSDLWIWRAGYVYDNSPIPDTTRSFELPGSDGHIFSFGCTRHGEVWDVDFGYSYMILKNSTAGTEALNGVGEFKNGDNHFVSLNFSRSY